VDILGDLELDGGGCFSLLSSGMMWHCLVLWHLLEGIGCCDAFVWRLVPSMVLSRAFVATPMDLMR